MLWIFHDFPARPVCCTGCESCDSNIEVMKHRELRGLTAAGRKASSGVPGAANGSCGGHTTKKDPDWKASHKLDDWRTALMMESFWFNISNNDWWIRTCEIAYFGVKTQKSRLFWCELQGTGTGVSIHTRLMRNAPYTLSNTGTQARTMHPLNISIIK